MTSLIELQGMLFNYCTSVIKYMEFQVQEFGKICVLGKLVSLALFNGPLEATNDNKK